MHRSSDPQRSAARVRWAGKHEKEATEITAAIAPAPAATGKRACRSDGNETMVSLIIPHHAPSRR
jgi:hypothetical protein